MKSRLTEAPSRRTGEVSIRSSAFTLVELLVVIAIIGILAALLMPSLGTARERAERTSCLSKLHQIGVGLIGYAQDHRGQLPPNLQYGPPICNYYETWINYIMLQHDGSCDPYEYGGLGFLHGQQYIPDAKVFFCPSQPEIVEGFNPPANPTAYAKSKCIQRLEDPSIVAAGSPAVISTYYFRCMEGYSHFGPMLRVSNSPKVAVITEIWRLDVGYNHEGGFTTLYINGSAKWISDPDRIWATDSLAFQKADMEY